MSSAGRIPPQGGSGTAPAQGVSGPLITVPQQQLADAALKIHQAAPQDVAAMPRPMLEGILERILGALPPERIAEFVIPIIAPQLAALVRQSPVAVMAVKAVAAELP